MGPNTPTDLEHVKMSFIFNAINNGWTVKKRKNRYFFTKKHENRREIFKEKYLGMFMKENMGI